MRLLHILLACMIGVPACSSAPRDYLAPVPPNDTIVVGKFVRLEGGKPIAWTKIHTILIATWSVRCSFEMLGQRLYEGNRLDESGLIATKGAPGPGESAIVSHCVWAGGNLRHEARTRFGEIKYNFKEKAVYVLPYIEARYDDSGIIPVSIEVDSDGKRTQQIIDEFRERYPAYAAHGEFIPLPITK